MNLRPLQLQLAVMALVSLAACKRSNTDLDNLQWLTGKWEGTMNESKIFEQWQRENDVLINGEGGTITNNDTVFSEDINIELIGDTVYYVAKLSANASPVSFKLVNMEKNKVVFENPRHDFPQRIIYRLNSDGSLTASIEGKNKESHIDYHFKKIK